MMIVEATTHEAVDIHYTLHNGGEYCWIICECGWVCTSPTRSEAQAVFDSHARV